MQKNRRFMHIVMLLIFLAIAVVINLIFNRLNISIDLTENELYKVSDEARRITDGIGREIDVYCFVGDENKANVICEYTRSFCETSDKLSFKAVDPVRHPELTKKYTSKGDEIDNNTVVFDNGENYKLIPYSEMFSYNYLTGQSNLFVAEERFCLAAMSLDRASAAKVAFLTGHGEKPDEGLKKRIRDMGAICEDKDIRNEEISGYDLLVLISPKIDFTAQEIEKIEPFLNNGGTMIVALDADLPRHEMLEGFFAEWGIEINRNLVFSTDAKSVMGNQPYSVIGRLIPHPVTDSLIKNGISPIFFASRSIALLWEAHDGISVTVLAESAQNASTVSIDTQQIEESGAFSLLTLSQSENGRIFAFGSNLFFSDELTAYNQDLIRNIIMWSADGEMVQGIMPKVITGSNIYVPRNKIFFWINIFGIAVPVIIAAAGITVAIRRRRR